MGGVGGGGEGTLVTVVNAWYLCGSKEGSILS